MSRNVDQGFFCEYNNSEQTLETKTYYRDYNTKKINGTEDRGIWTPSTKSDIMKFGTQIVDKCEPVGIHIDVNNLKSDCKKIRSCT